MEEPNTTEVTASAVVSFAEKLQDNSTKFYRKMAEMYAQDRETFLSFAKEDEKIKVLVTRTYQETISDALEACFSFKGLNLRDYLSETVLAEVAGYADTLRTALELEEKATEFYMDVAECSGSLLATIPNAFRKVAETRSKRKLKLKLLIDSLRR